jgi:hypothetical protein
LGDEGSEVVEQGVALLGRQPLALVAYAPDGGPVGRAEQLLEISGEGVVI